MTTRVNPCEPCQCLGLTVWRLYSVWSSCNQAWQNTLNLDSLPTRPVCTPGSLINKFFVSTQRLYYYPKNHTHCSRSATHPKYLYRWERINCQFPTCRCNMIHKDNITANYTTHKGAYTVKMRLWTGSWGGLCGIKGGWAQQSGDKQRDFYPLDDETGQTLYALGNIKERSRNHCYCWKPMRITNSVCVSVASVIQHARRMRQPYCHLWLAPLYLIFFHIIY